MPIKLPSRYEDLDPAYKGRLNPNQELIAVINKAHKSMQISGGIRFLPVYGESGAGKSCATRELATHMPDVIPIVLERDEIESKDALVGRIIKARNHVENKLIVAVIDQYEENVQNKEAIPTQFIEYVSLLDRGELKDSLVVFVWLTTRQDFRYMLVQATSRNRRILLSDSFNIVGPSKGTWPQIIEETFSFHNSEKPLSDFLVINNDLEEISREFETIGTAIEAVGERLAGYVDDLQNLSEYQVILMWPVADGLRNQRVMQFARPKDGYRLNWDAWYSELNEQDRKTLPLKELNRARLYFDLRVVPVRTADLHRLCLNLDNNERNLAESYLRRFKDTHFYHLVSDGWSEYDYNPVRERVSQRADQAKEWYEGVTTSPTQLGRRISKILEACGLESKYEETLESEFSTVRADIFVSNGSAEKSKKIVELKAFSSENTMPSTIKEQIKVTLRRHAQFAGFLQRQ